MKYAVDANLFRQGSTNPKKKNPAPGFFLWAFKTGGLLSGGFCPGDFCPVAFDLEPCFRMRCSGRPGPAGAEDGGHFHGGRADSVGANQTGAARFGQVQELAPEVRLCLAKHANSNNIYYYKVSKIGGHSA